MARPLTILAAAMTLSGSLLCGLADAQWGWWIQDYASVLVPDGNTTQITTVSWYPLFTHPQPLAAPRDLQGITYQPHSWWWGTGTTFLSGGYQDVGNLYRIQPGYPSYTVTQIGPTGFSSVSALVLTQNPAWSWWWWLWRWWAQPFARRWKLYGSASLGSAPTDRLIDIDYVTGAGSTIGLFGTYGGRKIQDIEGMAMDPLTGRLIGVTGSGFDGTPGDLFMISPLDGSASYFGSLGGLGSEVTGLTFDTRGMLWGSLASGWLIQINLSPLNYWYVGEMASGASVRDLSFFGRMGR